MANKRVTFDVLAIAKAVGFDKAGREVKKLADDGNKRVGALMTSIIALGPAMVPLAAGATALGLGLTGLGAAGLVAFLGIKEQMKAGTLQAQPLGQAIKQMQLDFAGMKALTATAIAPGLTVGLQKINALTPNINTLLEGFATQLGAIASHVGPGLVSLFIRLQPLFLALGDQLVRLSAGFERWATSGKSVNDFVGYSLKNLPAVEKTLAALAVAIVHLVQGLAPLGGVSFSTIGLMARLVAAIPVPILKDLAPIIAGIVLATKAWAIGQKALNLVVEANPFVRVAVLILAVGTALVEAYKHSETFRNVVKTVLKDVELAFLYLAKFNIQYFLIPMLNIFSAIVHGAAAAFGWVPGIGGKLKKARSEFDTFRRGVDTALHGINVQIDTLQAGKALAHVHDMISKLQSKQITLTTYVQQVILPTLGTPSVTHDSHRAAGGPAYRGMPLIVGEHRPEVFVPPSNGRIVPRVSSQGGGGSSGPTQLEVMPAGSTAFEQFMVMAMRQWVRVRGGDVQKVLGTP